MANMVLVPPYLLWVMAVFFIILIGFTAYLLMFLSKMRNKDLLIFLDKTNRWKAIYDDVTKMDKYKKEKETYILKEDSGILNKKGKALYIFSENNPLPLKLQYKKPEWLDAKSLMATINNELIKLMLNPTNSTKDLIMMLGAIGGIVAGFSSVVILLMQSGVIK